MEDVFMVGESDIDSYKEHFTKNVHTWDFLISQNPFSSETFRRAFDFHREMLEYGYPRNDILFRENTTEGIRSFTPVAGADTKALSSQVLDGGLLAATSYFRRLVHKLNPSMNRSI